VPAFLAEEPGKEPGARRQEARGFLPQAKFLFA